MDTTITQDDLARAELLLLQEQRRKVAQAEADFPLWLKAHGVELKVAPVIAEDGRITCRVWFVAASGN